MLKINEILTPDEIRELKTPSDFHGFLSVATTWGMIAASFAIAAWHPSFLTFFLAIVILGGRHLALAILMHDASHYSLFRTRWLNDFIGSWFCAYPTWQDLRRYRPHHMRHHQYAGSLQDPDHDLIAPFPVSKWSLFRKFARDLSGLSGLKRIYGLLLMDFGFIKYTVSASIVPINQTGRKFSEVLKTGARNLHGVVLTNLALFLILSAFGKPWLYLLWLAGYLSAFSIFVRIRSLAEHAVTDMDLDPFKSTRTTLASPLARVTVAPHRVNYHLEHHLLMTVPSYKFPRMHQMLASRDALEGAHIARNYGEVLKLATSTPSPTTKHATEQT